MASQPESVLVFFNFKHCFGHHWDGQDCQPIAAFLAIYFLPSGPLLKPLRAQIKGLPIDTPLKLFTISDFPLRTESLAS